ncbi:MAG: DEAD/DEAH box helicase [Nanoarchaeota archaeon]
MESFKKFGLSEDLLRVIQELEFSEPTEIQEKAIPYVLKGRDVIGKSATGSGKTLAFGSGIVETTQKGKGIQALVLTPTRELAEQVAQSLKKFSKHHKFFIQEIYGGVSITNQIHKLSRTEIVVGTPGRILDHLRRNSLNLSDLKILVLDEADRMVDMGFLPDVETIIKQCPQKKQTLLFSATITQEVDYIAKKYMNNPEYITVESYVDASKLHQYYYDTPNHIKFSLLIYLLKQEKPGLVMVFCNTRRNADSVTNNLKRFGLHAVAIHGGLTQSRRSSIMQDFHAEEIAILVCTDVAARGLDIKNVSHIYNYDVPNTSVEYIHRVGRTARAGEEGEAISLVSSRDYENFRKVMADESLKIEEKQIPNIEIVPANFMQRHKERFHKRRGDKPRFSSRRSNRNRRR